MANTVSQLWSTVLKVNDALSAVPQAHYAFLDSVYIDKNPDQPGVIGQQVNIAQYDLGPLASIANNAPSPRNVNPYVSSLIFQNHHAGTYTIGDYEQWAISVPLVEAFMKALRVRVKEDAEQQISSLATVANFNALFPVAGSLNANLAGSDVTAIWRGLASSKVPMSDPFDLSLIVNHNTWAGMAGSDYWTRYNILGLTAQAARERGSLPQSFNLVPKWGQFAPGANSRPLYGQHAVTNGSATVTGYATGYTTDCPANTVITFASDPTQTEYTVSSVTNDNSLTLSTNYTGATAAYTTAKISTPLAGTVAFTGGSASNAVVGTSTTFTTALTVGSWIVFNSDVTRTAYQVASITDNTHLTTTVDIACPTETVGVVSNVTNYTLGLHRAAICFAPRRMGGDLELMNRAARVLYIDIDGIPTRLTVFWNPLTFQTQVSADYGYALSVIRPTLGQILLS